MKIGHKSLVSASRSGSEGSSPQTAQSEPQETSTSPVERAFDPVQAKVAAGKPQKSRIDCSLDEGDYPTHVTRHSARLQVGSESVEISFQDRERIVALQTD